MKKTIMSLCLLASTSAFADASLFTGRFSVDTANCSHWSLMGAERVYISHGKSLNGAPTLNVAAYGDDASGLEILLGQGGRQQPGTVRDIHGDVSHDWITTVRGNSLKSVETVKRPSIGYSSRTITRLIAQDDTLEIQVTEEGGNSGDRTSYCRLERY